MPISDRVLDSHLDGKYAIAIYAASEGSKFMCFDVDDGRQESVMAIVNCLVALGIDSDSLHVSTSGGKGYHVEMFFDGLVSVDLLYSLYDMVLQRAMLSRKKVEFRPTAHQAVKLPLSVHHKTGRRCWYIDKEHMVSVEDWNYLKIIPKLPALGISAWIENLKPVELDGLDALASSDAESFPYREHSDFVYLAPLRSEGMRHTTTVNHVVHMRKLGIGREECMGRIIAWQERQDSSLYKSTAAYIQQDIEEIVQWAYETQDEQRLYGTNIILTRHDMQTVFSISKPDKRKLMFLLLLWEKANHPSLSHEQMGLKIGCCAKTVKSMIDGLVKDGMLEQNTGRNRFISGKGFCRNRNTYHCLHGIGTQENIAHSVSIPKKNVLKLLSYWMYECAYHLLTMGEFLTALTPKEHSDIKCWLKKHASDIQPAEAVSQAAS